MLILFTDQRHQTSNHFNTKTRCQTLCGPSQKSCGMPCAVLLFILFVHVSADYLQNTCDAGQVLPIKKKYHTTQQFITIKLKVPGWCYLHYLLLLSWQSCGRHKFWSWNVIAILLLWLIFKLLKIQKHKSLMTNYYKKLSKSVWKWRAWHIILIYNLQTLL